MKRFALLLALLVAFLVAPTGAFAKDKHRHHKKYSYRSCDYRSYSRYDDCRPSSRYYGRSYYRPSYSSYYARPYYSAPVYYSPYRSSYYGGRNCSPYRSGGFRVVVGF